MGVGERSQWSDGSRNRKLASDGRNRGSFLDLAGEECPAPRDNFTDVKVSGTAVAISRTTRAMAWRAIGQINVHHNPVVDGCFDLLKIRFVACGTRLHGTLSHTPLDAQQYALKRNINTKHSLKTSRGRTLHKQTSRSHSVEIYIKVQIAFVLIAYEAFSSLIKRRSGRKPNCKPILFK